MINRPQISHIPLATKEATIIAELEEIVVIEDTDVNTDVEAEYKCESCEEVFNCYTDVTNHVRPSHKPEDLEFPCETCDFKTTNIELEKHKEDLHSKDNTEK